MLQDEPAQSWLFLLMATLSLTMGLWLLRSLPSPLHVITVICALTLLMAIRFVHLGLVNFSGSGFSAEFFLHLDWHTLEASWHLYGWRIPLGIVAVLAVIYICLQLNLRLPALKAKHALSLSLLALLGLMWSQSSLPETHFFRASVNGLKTNHHLPDLYELQNRWRSSELVSATLTPKSKLQVKAPDTPQNLIFIYLESVGLSVMEHPDWPELMPFLSALNHQHSLTNNLHASGFITIEGIVNSQCGTLFPFGSGSDSLANGANLAENMICLGDVLSAAGYDNHYLGGASIDFSGKGAFLKAHGYPQPRGTNHWISQGLKPQDGTWGISDADIFSKATELLTELQGESLPFNLTLLTIGTHIPGFLYEQCQPYPHDEDPFINALHCTDQLLEQWVEQLTQLGLLENTLLAITADHQVFPNSRMRSLFGDKVYDRRMPVILLNSKSTPEPIRKIGASYDLAPTLLDLLNIKHNASFALGRSLFDEDYHPLYFVNRYEDFLGTEVKRRTATQCNDSEAAPADWSQPMSFCQTVDLMNLLRRQVELLSNNTPTIACDHDTPLAAAINQSGNVQISINANDITEQFTNRGRPLKENQSGLYLLWFNEKGRLINLQFAPADSAHSRILSLPDSNHASTWLALWKPEENNQPPEWLPAEHSEAGIFLATIQGENVDWEAQHDASVDSGLQWALSKQQCQSLYGQ
ncbi:MAG TPA: LTA synthase family protein [Cellvibrionaceae bacterium]